MRHALYVPNFRSYADPRRLADLARDAEAAGWEGVFIWDHVWASIGLAPGQPTADAWIALAAMASATERILVGPMITPLARRRPWKVARELVTLDHLSGGRVVFGAGLGMPLEEYTAFGEDADARVRAEKLDEGLAVLECLLSGEPFSFAGRHYTLRDVHFGPRPVQARIPIWIAGTWPTKSPFRRAVRFDGVIPLGKHAFPTAEELAAVRTWVDEHRDRTRPYDLVAMGFTRDAADVARVRAAREAGATWWLESLHDDLTPWEVARGAGAARPGRALATRPAIESTRSCVIFRQAAGTRWPRVEATMRETSEIQPLPPFPDGEPAAASRRAPMRLVRPLRAASPRPRYRPLAPAGFPLIGRRRELSELGSALDAALAGHSRVVLVGGEPGIGKTRLTSVVADDAAARGVPVWWGRGWEDGSAPAFWPWNTGLRRFLEQAGPDAVAAAAGTWGPDLAHVFPVLREHLPELPPSEGSESDGARFQLFEIVSRFLAAVAKPAGLVVVLDDVHWADRPSLKLLEFVASALTDARLLVIGTFRDTEVERDDACFAAFARMSREPSTRRIVLGGLSREECAHWVTLTTLAGDASSLAPALHRETNGNPFFVGEIVQLLSAEDGTSTEVPHGARGVIARRLDRLGDDCRATLALAALCGDPFDVGTLAEVVEGEPSAHLARALRARILVENEGHAGRYGFAHALIRRVLLDELEPATRRAGHARIAAVLERRAAVSDVVTTELVRHFAAAGTAEGLRKAFDYACEGGEQASRGLGFEEAVRLYELALDLGGGAGFLDARRAVELKLALARALRGAGDVPAARARCSEVVAACRRTPDADALARAALIHAGPVPEFGRIEPAARAILEEAAKAGDALDDALRARLYARLAGDLIAANEIEQGARVFALCEDAAAAAERAGAPGPLAVAHTGIYYAAAMGMRPAGKGPAIPSVEDILAAAEAGREHEYAAAIRHARAAMLFAFGEADAFAGEIDGLATAAAASRVPMALWLVDALAGLRATVEGRFVEARDVMERALATGRRMQLANAVGVHASQRIMWHVMQGRLAEIAGEIETFVDEHPLGAGWRPVRALARLACGDTVAARAELQSLLAGSLSRAERGVMARCYLMGLALLCIALRDREQAPALYERVARRSRIDVWSVDGCQTLGPWAIALGGLARLCDRPADAVRHFEDAIATARRMGSRPIVAHAQSMLASVQLSMAPSADERVRIAETLEQAAQSAEELDLADVVARVARLRAKLAQPVALASLPANAFRCDGEVWTVRFEGRDVRLRDGKGPRYLARLLTAPGQDVHVLELAGGAPATMGTTDGLTVASGGGIDDAPDARARREYRDMVAELRAELDEAEEHCDTGRAERLRAELELFSTQLAQQFGSHTRTRGPAETARKAVTKVLRTQIMKLLDVHPALGEHLRDAIRMGTYCSYAPRTPVVWEV